MTTFITILIVALAAAAGVYLTLRYALVFPLIDRPQRRPTESSPSQSARVNRLRTHLRSIATVPHNTHHYAALEMAADYVVKTLSDFGYEPDIQSFIVDGNTPVRNISVCLKADHSAPTAIQASDTLEPGQTERETLVIGAHYDSAGHSPGANDNGSGVAALLEICRDLRGFQPANQNIKLAFFVNEEAPYCKTPDMGSWRFAELLVKRGDRVSGMMALETLGYFSDQKGTQHFPFPFDHIYPDRGDFIAFVGLPKARAFTHAATKAFRDTATFPSIGGIAPGVIPGIDLSDHWSFNQFGIPALMITDTAPFRNPYYHRLDDIPANVNCSALAQITDGLVGMITTLAPGTQNERPPHQPLAEASGSLAG
ncbi:MAG: M20/M25/M40 family metallo-hydrolase [Pseudomonadota bacterium]